MKETATKVYSKYAIDYSEGLDIYDPIKKEIYTEYQAKFLPKNVRGRLVMRPRKIGCLVNDI